MSGKRNRGTGSLQGIIYGLAPHTFCILFIVFSVVGATAATRLLKGLFYLPYFVEIIVALGVLSATASALIYLKRNGLLSWPGIRFKWKYLVTMYATTVAVNLLFFYVIFPALANVNIGPVRADSASAEAVVSQAKTTVTLEVDIPCAGHAPLIIGEVEKVAGVADCRYEAPNLFTVTYSSASVSLEEILGQQVFESFAARVVQP